MNYKAIEYKCGHKCGCIILDCNELSLAAYLIWKDSTGYDGDKSKCWGCWCKERKENRKTRRNNQW